MLVAVRAEVRRGKVSGELSKSIHGYSHLFSFLFAPAGVVKQSHQGRPARRFKVHCIGSRSAGLEVGLVLPVVK